MTHHLTRVRAPLTRYGAAVLLTMLTLLIRLLLAPLLGEHAPLLLFTIPVVLSAWYGGFRPSLLALALSVLVGDYFFLPPPATVSIATQPNLMVIGVFVFQGLLLAGLSAVLHARTQTVRHVNAQLQLELAERQRAEAELQHQALHDALTGLPNRALFQNRLVHALARAQRHPPTGFAMLFLDLDRFKHINDSLGHLQGDQLLITVAQRLAHCVRTEDTIARFGGDEFALLLEDIAHPRDATYVATRIQQVLATPIELNGSEVVVSASIGIALCTPGCARPEDLLRDADTALYRAKAQGRARTVIFDPVMHAQAIRRLQLEAELRRAIEQEQLQLHYQPIIALPSGTISGLEALVRWQHPARGLIAPAEFIPLAEETGLIVPLGEWVLHTACTQTHAWHAAGLPPLTVAVNLSVRQFQDTGVSARIATTLAATRLPPAALKLELTESSLLEDTGVARTRLWELHELGIQG